MPAPDPRLAARTQRVEAITAHAIRTKMGNRGRSPAKLADHRNVRLAITVADPVAGYPASPANTFSLRFLDSYFLPRSQGQRTATHEERADSTEVQAIGHNLTDDYLAEGTVVWALWQRGLGAKGSGEWWIERVGSSADLKLVVFELTATLSLGGSAAAKKIGSCSDDAPDTFTVEDPTSRSHKGESGYRGVAFLYESDVGCNWQIIWMEHRAHLAQFSLNAPFSGSPSTTTGNLVDYWWGRPPNATETLLDPCGAYSNKEAGDCVIAFWSQEESEEYVVIDPTDDFPDLAVECLTYPLGTEFFSIPDAEELKFDKSNFRMFSLPVGNGGHLEFRPPYPLEENQEQGWLLHGTFNAANEAKGLWHRDVQLGYNLEVGVAAANTPIGWFISTGAQAGGWGISSGDGIGYELWRSPEVRGNLTHGSHLFVEKLKLVDAEACIGFGWSMRGRGNYSSVAFEDHQSRDHLVYIDKGIVVQWLIDGAPQLSDIPEDEDISCTISHEGAYDPCKDPPGLDDPPPDPF